MLDALLQPLDLRWKVSCPSSLQSGILYVSDSPSSCPVTDQVVSSCHDKLASASMPSVKKVFKMHCESVLQLKEVLYYCIRCRSPLNNGPKQRRQTGRANSSARGCHQDIGMGVQAEPNAGTRKVPYTSPLRRSQRPRQPPHNHVCAAHCKATANWCGHCPIGSVSSCDFHRMCGSACTSTHLPDIDCFGRCVSC